MAQCVIKSGARSGSIVFPSTTTLGNVEVNNRVRAAFEATVKVLNAAGRLADFKVDAGPANIGAAVDSNNVVNSIVTLIESRGDVVGAFAANAFVTTGLGNAVGQLKAGARICSFGFDLGPSQREQIRQGN